MSGTSRSRRRSRSSSRSTTTPARPANRSPMSAIATTLGVARHVLTRALTPFTAASCSSSRRRRSSSSRNGTTVTHAEGQVRAERDWIEVDSAKGPMRVRARAEDGSTEGIGVERRRRVPRGYGGSGRLGGGGGGVAAGALQEKHSGLVSFRSSCRRKREGEGEGENEHHGVGGGHVPMQSVAL